MSRFQFRLAALQRYREHLRDVVRQQLAELLSRDAALAAERDAALGRRSQTIGEMQALQQQSRLDVDQAAARRYHAGQLTADARRLEWQRQQLGSLIVSCRERLIHADQGVKVLEQLADKQRREFEQRLEHQEARQREEAWQAGIGLKVEDFGLRARTDQSMRYVSQPSTHNSQPLLQVSREDSP